MKPDLGDWRAFFRSPRIVSLRSAEDETPVDSPNILLFENRQVGDKLGTRGSSHILGADDRSIVFHHPINGIYCALFIAIGMESDHIALGKDKIVDFSHQNISIPMP